MSIRSFWLVLICLALLPLLSLGCLPIRTQHSQDRDAQMVDLQQRVEAVEQQNRDLQERFDQSSGAAGQAVMGYERLQNEIEILQDRFDELSHNNDLTREQLETLQQRLVRELEQLNRHITALENNQVYDPGTAEYEAQETEAMNRAMALFRQGNLEAAKAKFREFIDKFPQSKRLHEVRFYLAECYFKQRNWEQAILNFDNIIREHPESEYVPTAYLHMGISFYENGQTGDAKLLFRQVVELFPGTQEAKIAKKKLELMQ